MDFLTSTIYQEASNQFDKSTRLTILEQRLDKLHKITETMNPQKIILMFPSIKVPAFKNGLVLFNGFFTLQAHTKTGFNRDTVEKIKEKVTNLKSSGKLPDCVEIYNIDEDDAQKDSDETIELSGRSYQVAELFSEEELEKTKDGKTDNSNQLHLSEKGAKVILTEINEKFGLQLQIKQDEPALD